MRRGLGALGEGREEEARRGGRARSVERGEVGREVVEELEKMSS